MFGMSNTGNALKGSPFEVFLFLERARKPKSARVGRSACLEGDGTRWQKPHAADRQGDARREQAAEGADQDWLRRPTPPRVRSWPNRIRTTTRREGQGLRLRDHWTLSDPEATWRADQDRWARLPATGRVLARWPAERRLNTQPGRRGDPRSVASARRRRQQPGVGPASTQRLLAAPRHALPRQDLVEPCLLPVVIDAQIRRWRPPRRRSPSIGGDHHI